MARLLLIISYFTLTCGIYLLGHNKVIGWGPGNTGMFVLGICLCILALAQFILSERLRPETPLHNGATRETHVLLWRSTSLGGKLRGPGFQKVKQEYILELVDLGRSKYGYWRNVEWID